MSGADDRKLAFRFFTEIGIIQQLATSMFNKRLPDGLHVSHFAVLNHLTRLGDGKTPVSLANAFQVTKGTMTNTLSVLTRRGLIRTERHAVDRRSKLVYLTDAGRTFRQQAIDRLDPLFAMLRETLDLDQVIRILPTLEAVRKVLDENRDR